MFWLQGKLRELQRQSTQQKDKIADLEKDIEAAETRRQQGIREMRRVGGKIKLQLLSQITDYERELNFWRDTLRKFLYQCGRSDADAERLLQSVTSNLETYKTRGSAAPAFEAAKFMSETFLNHEDDESEPGPSEA
ncbi:MAG: hypothetical protein R6X20_12165 [Phycisphaerae bacterium]